MHATPSRKSETTLGVQAYLTHISVVIHGIEEERSIIILGVSRIGFKERCS